MLSCSRKLCSQDVSVFVHRASRCVQMVYSRIQFSMCCFHRAWMEDTVGLSPVLTLVRVRGIDWCLLEPVALAVNVNYIPCYAVRGQKSQIFPVGTPAIKWWAGWPNIVAHGSIWAICTKFFVVDIGARLDRGCVLKWLQKLHFSSKLKWRWWISLHCLVVLVVACYMMANQ